MLPVGEICEFKYGSALPERSRVSGDVPVFGSNGQVGSHSDAITAGPAIVIGRKGSVGKVVYSDRPCWPIDTAYFIDAGATGQDLKWLAYALDSLGLDQLNKATGVPGLNRNDAYQKTLAVPPLDEQWRIAAILDQADALRRKRRKSLNSVQSLGAALFSQMLGEQPWPRAAFSEIATIEAGLVDPKLPAFADLPHIGPEHIQGGSGEILPYRTASQDGVTSGKFPFDETCVLYSKIRPELNKVALAPGKGVCSADMYPIRPIEGRAVRSYILFTLRNSDFLRHAASLSNRANIPKINKDQLFSYQVPLVPLSHQCAFEARWTRVVESENRLRAHLAELDALFASLQHRAFRGEL